MKVKILVGLALLSVVLIASRFTARSSADPVPAVAVRRGDVYRSVTATGRIEPRIRVQIKSKVSGIARAVYVREGDVVAKDQVLLDLDRDYLESQYRGAKAAYDVAEASEREAHADVEQAHAQLERARSEAGARQHEMAFVESEFSRKRLMFEQLLISRAEVESTENQRNQARSSLGAAVSSVAAAEAQLKRAELAVGRAKAAMAQALASVELAQEELRNASIRSPIDGVVLARHVEVGDAIASILTQGAIAPLLMELGDASELVVKGLVNEADIAHVHLKQPVMLTVESYRDRRLKGRIAKIAPVGNQKDNVTTFEVEIAVEDNSDVPLKANMSATAEIVLEARRNVLLVPESALIYDAGQSYVEVLAADAAGEPRRVPVETGLSDGIHTEVRRGLDEGRQIVYRQ